MAVTINIPSQVKTYANLAAFPASGSLKTIYIAEDTNKTYRWDGSTYVEISASAATGLTVGTTPISSGTIGRVLFQGTGNVLQQSSSLFWDGTNERLGIGTSTPTSALDLFGSIGLGSASSVGLNAVSGRITFKNGTNNTRIESVQIDGTFPQNQRLDFYPHTSNAAAFQIGFNNITSVLNHNFSANALLTASSSVTFAHSSGVSEGIRFDATTKRIRLNSFYVSIEGNTNEVFQATDGTNVLMRLRGNGNLLLNTTTDAGFRLDVNGTSRITGLAYQTGYAYSVNRLQFNQGVSTTNVGYINGISNGVIRFTNASETDFTRLQFGGGTTAYPSLQRSGSALAVMDATGTSLTNLLIGTTTDAGFKLDVNGTAIVRGVHEIQNNSGLRLRATGGGASTSFRSSGNSAEIRTNDASIACMFFNQNGVVGFSQPVAFGNTVVSSASALVQIDSTTQGFLPPRMTTTQRNAIASPAAGLVVYDNTDNKHYGYNGTTWNAFY